MKQIISDGTERGKEDIFAFGIDSPKIPLLNISGLTLINGMNKKGAGWRLEKIRIAVRDSQGNFWWLTEGRNHYLPINKWLDTKDRNGPAEAIPFLLDPFQKQDMDRYIRMNLANAPYMTAR